MAVKIQVEVFWVMTL